jgi:hypothetical protein
LSENERLIVPIKIPARKLSGRDFYFM